MSSFIKSRLHLASLTAGVQPRATSDATAAVSVSPMLRQDAFKGIYEVEVAADPGSVFVATINGFDKENAGFIQCLDVRSLQPVQTIQVPHRSFALGVNRVTNTHYVGNTMEGSLSVTPDGATLYVTVKAPHGEKHPAWRKDAADSVVRIDLR